MTPLKDFFSESFFMLPQTKESVPEDLAQYCHAHAIDCAILHNVRPFEAPTIIDTAKNGVKIIVRKTASKNMELDRVYELFSKTGIALADKMSYQETLANLLVKLFRE